MAGQKYKFEVYVETHLGEKSAVKSAMVERKNAVQPLLIDLGTNKIDVDPSKDFRLRVKTKKSDCVTFDLTGVEVTSLINILYKKYFTDQLITQCNFS